jgi:Xaa-Pro aminopeptidase
VTDLLDDEAFRIAQLLEAQAQAVSLFDEVGRRGIIAPGVSEREASDAIRDLANEMFGATRHWHKRIVRAGPNTLQPYRKNPPDRIIEADDIAFCDFGPIFDDWEADLGRTFVIGDDPDRLRLRDDLSAVFDAARAFFEASPDITGEALFHHVVALGEARGWTWGGTIAGHLVGHFPHEEIEGDDVYSTIMPGNDRRMRGHESGGHICHWILEVHLVDVEQQIGGFFEQLLDIGD